MSSKTKDQIITLLIEHSRIIYSVISDLGVFYNGWSEGYDKNKETLEKKKNKMLLSEEDADAIKIKLIKDFSEAGTQGLGEYVSLVLRMDNVINSALEFVDILCFIDSNVEEEIKKRYYKLINIIITMADSFKTTIKSLRDNPEDVLHNTTIIHEQENEVDVYYRQFLNYIYDKDSLNTGQILRIRDSIIILEQLADRIHDIADVIRVLRYQ